MKKVVDIKKVYSYNDIRFGGIAQLARAHGSYPWCHGFKSLFRYFQDVVLVTASFFLITC